MVAIVKKNKSLEVLESPINAFQPSHTKRGVKCYWRWLSIVDGPMDLTDDETSDDSENNESLALLLPRSSEYKCDPFGAIERCKEERFRQEKAELKSLWNRHLIPDGPWKVAQDQVLLEEKGVKLLKFSFVSVVSILLIHYYALAAVRVPTKIPF